MKIELIPVRAYEVRAGGRTIGFATKFDGWRELSELRCLEPTADTLIVASAAHADDSAAIDAEVVKASPTLETRIAAALGAERRTMPAMATDDAATAAEIGKRQLSRTLGGIVLQPLAEFGNPTAHPQTCGADAIKPGDKL